MSELAKVYGTLEELLEYSRTEWAKDYAKGLKRKESYWQGKKDGVRAAMNLIYQIMTEEDKQRARG